MRLIELLGTNGYLSTYECRVIYTVILEDYMDKNMANHYFSSKK